MAACTVSREVQGDRLVLRLGGQFDRAGAWALREQLEHEPAGEVVLDFSLVRDISDLGVAVLAHGLTVGTRRVLFRGLRQHQLRIFRYCGVSFDEATAREIASGEPPAAAGEAKYLF